MCERIACKNVSVLNFIQRQRGGNCDGGDSVERFRSVCSNTKSLKTVVSDNSEDALPADITISLFCFAGHRKLGYLLFTFFTQCVLGS